MVCTPLIDLPCLCEYSTNPKHKPNTKSQLCIFLYNSNGIGDELNNEFRTNNNCSFGSLNNVTLASVGYDVFVRIKMFVQFTYK